MKAFLFEFAICQAALRAKFAKDTTTEYPAYIEEIQDRENDNPRSDDDENSVTKPLM